MKKNKAYKYRIYPSPLQKELLAKTFGCVRFIYNKMLTDKIEHYQLTKKSLANTPAQYKDEYQFLKEVDSLALANAQRNLQTAYRNFFTQKDVGFPRFKSKKNEASYTTNLVNGNIVVINNAIKTPKGRISESKTSSAASEGCGNQKRYRKKNSGRQILCIHPGGV